MIREAAANVREMATDRPPRPTRFCRAGTPIDRKKLSVISDIERLLYFCRTMSSMITTTAWVRRGVAAQFPTKYEIDEAEMNRISELARMQLEDAQGELNAAKGDGDAMEEDNKEEAMEEDTENKSSKEGSNAKPTEFVKQILELKKFDANIPRLEMTTS